MRTEPFPCNHQIALPKFSEEELKAAIAAGVTSGRGKPADEVFNRLETKYRQMDQLLILNSRPLP